MTRHGHGPLYVHRHGHAPKAMSLKELDAREARPAATDKAKPAETIVSVVYVTAPKTFDGPAVYVTLTPSGSPRSTTRATANTNTAVTTTAKATSITSATAAAQTDSSDEALAKGHPLVQSSSTSIARSTAAAVPSLGPSSSVGQSVLPTNVAVSSALVGAAVTSQATPMSAASSNLPSPSGQMSGGAKAGLALGILVAIGAVLTAVLCLYSRKKRRDRSVERLADEKGNNRSNATTFMASEKPSNRTTKTMSTAPRLSLRPLSMFPNIAGDRKSAAINMEGAPATTGTAQTDANGFLTATSQPTASAWEKRGAHNNANDPANPFGNHAEMLSTSPPSELAAVTAVAPVAAAAGVRLSSTELKFPEPATAKSDVSPSQIPLPSTPTQASNQVAQPAVIPGSSASAAIVTPVAASTARAAPQGSNNVHRVQLDFKPSMDDELELRAGQLVRILHEYDDGWALCIRMDRSQQGVVPRTCLSRHPVKPRPSGPPPQSRQHASPPRMRPAPAGNAFAQARPLSPSTGRNSPNSFASPMPSGRNSPSTHGSQPQIPTGLPMPVGRPRAQSNVSPYTGHPRALSPGPYGAGNPQPMVPVEARRRSNSMGQLQMGPSSAVPMRKPVPRRDS